MAGRPLAERLRPKTLDDYVGQEHILGPGKPLRLQIEKDQLSSMILWGPPGAGKTTLANLIAHATRAEFVPFSAVMSGIKEIKAVMADSERNRSLGRRTVIFVDEIHRFNKAQQDAFLPYVERGDIVLIGATTENPSFEIVSALLSRSRTYILRALTVPELMQLLQRGAATLGVTAGEEVLEQMALFSNGDARSAYNLLELVASAAEGEQRVITPQTLADATQRKMLVYDKAGEEHFNLISALHKSVRSSDVDASLYWLARMLEGGEDRMYLARRLVRMAIEDIGMADPKALEQAMAAQQAAHFLGSRSQVRCGLQSAGRGDLHRAKPPRGPSSHAVAKRAHQVHEGLGIRQGLPARARVRGCVEHDGLPAGIARGDPFLRPQRCWRGKANRGAFAGDSQVATGTTGSRYTEGVR
jgi:putative ATPase